MSGIYKITNTLTNKCYVGSAKNFDTRWKRHFRDLNNGNHSSIKLQRSFDKHGESVFVPEILEELPYEKDIIIERENYWMTALNSKANGYNIADALFGDTLSNHPRREEIISKRAKTIKEKCQLMTQKERSEKFGKPGELNGMFGKTHSEEVKKRLSEINLGNTYSKGRVFSDDQKAKLSEYAKARTGEKNPFYGKTHTKETKLKLSESRKGTTPSNSKRVVVDGVEYLNRRVAEEKTGIKSSTIWHRCNSKNKKYIDTYFID